MRLNKRIFFIEKSEVRTIANNIKGITVEINGETGPLDKALKGVNKTTRDLQGELRAVDKALKLDPKNTVLLAQKQELLAKSITNTKGKLEALKEAEKQAEEQFKQGKIGEEQFRALQREVISTTQNLRNLERQYVEVGTTASRSITAAGDSIKKVGDGVTNVGKKASVASAVVMGAGVAAVASYKSVKEGMDEVIKATGATGQAAKDLEVSYKNIGRNSTADFVTIGQTLGEVNTRFDMTGKAAEECTLQFIRFAKINNIDAKTSVQLVSRAMGDAGIKATDYGKVLDMLTVAAQKSGIGMDILTTNLAKYGAPMRALGIDTETSIAMFAGWEKAGVNTEIAFAGMKKAISNWGKEGKDSSKEFAKALEEIKKAPDIAAATSMAIDIFGQKAGPDLADAIKGGRFEVQDYVEALKKSGGAVTNTTDQMADGTAVMAKATHAAQIASAEFGDMIVKTLIPIITKITEKIKKFTDYLSGLDEGTRKRIVMIGLVIAAIGPLILLIGSLISAVGSIVAGVGAAIPVIGAMAGTFTALTGPIGLTLIAIGLVTAAVIGLTKSSKDNNTVSFDTLQARQKEIDKNDDLIKSFDGLRIKNQLSNSEMGRFLDINSELAKTASPERIAALKDEQAKLLEKSGLTNKEMDNFLNYNDKIIEKAPGTETAISAQGKAFAANTFELQKVNAEKLESLRIDAEAAINNNLDKENEERAKQLKLIEEIKIKDAERATSYENINRLAGEIQTKENEVLRLKKEQKANIESGDIDAINLGKTKLDQAEQELITLNEQKSAEGAKLNTLLNQIKARQDSKGVLDADLKKLDEQKYKYESIVLATVGLTAERGKGLATIQLELAKLEQEKTQLKDLHSSGKLNTAEYNEQVSVIDEQIGKLQVPIQNYKTSIKQLGKPFIRM